MNILNVLTKSYSILYDKEINHADLRWLNPRLNYINSLINHTPLNRCPECGAPVTLTEDEDECYCTKCGLVVAGSIEYVAGFKVDYPFGRR